MKRAELISKIREVSISGKTYEEYVEAVADRLLAEGELLLISDTKSNNSEVKSNKQIEVKANAKDIKGLADLLVDFGRTYDDSIQGLEDLLIEAIITAGYRKASEVAREVIDDFDKELHKLADRYYEHGKIEYFTLCEIIYQLVIAELKKKYTEEGK